MTMILLTILILTGMIQIKCLSQKKKQFYIIMKDLTIETRRLRSGFLYYKLTRITLDELDFEETEINESNINDSNINDYSRFIFENMTDINCIEEFRHTKEDLENYRKGLN